jgi:glycosyltransferase involved in cell wall biosynthesis
MAALARELARRHSVTILTSGAPGLPPESSDHGVRVIRVPVFFRRELAVANFPSMMAYLPMGALRGLQWRRGSQYDVINTHFVVPSGPLGHVLGRLYRVPNVLSVHGGDLYDPSKSSSPHRHSWLRLPIRHLLQQAHALVGQSRNTLQHVADIYRVQRQAELIPLGIERPTVPAAASRREFGVPDDAFLMVTVGRVVARKAPEQLIEAMRAARPANTHLIVIGDGPRLAAMRQAAARANLAERVHLLGQASEERKNQALAISDVFVSTSQHEGFGLVFLEAMAFGLPVICYDHGGQEDFLSNGETGALLPLNDLQAFARAISDLAADTEARRRMGQHNRRLVERYLIDTCAARYEKVFEDAVRNFSSQEKR